MINVNEFAEKVFGILKGFHCQLKLYDNTGNEILSPSNTRRFFSYDPNLMVTIDEVDQSLVVSLGQTVSLEETEKLQHTLRALANQYLYNYQIRTFGKSVQPRDFSHEIKAKKFAVSESFSPLSGSKKKSKQNLKQVKIHIDHLKEVTDQKKGERSRNIKNIFVETADESFCMPTKSLTAARAMANHIYRGGNFQDQIASYICEQSVALNSLKEFVKYAKQNNLISESTYDTIATVRESINSIKSTLLSLSKPKSYEVVKERITQHDLLENSTETADVEKIKDMFTVKTFNESLNDILPYISKQRTAKQKFIEHVTELSMLPVALKTELPDTTLLEFTDKRSKIVYVIEGLESCVKDRVLATYLTQLKERVNTNMINKYDMHIIENLVKNSFIDTGSSTGENLAETSELSILKFLK